MWERRISRSNIERIGGEATNFAVNVSNEIIAFNGGGRENGSKLVYICMIYDVYSFMR